MSAILNEQLLTSFQPSKILRNNIPETSITSLDFDDTGRFCVTASKDESIQVYDCKSGKHSRTSFSKKYGADHARFTHSSTNVIYASTKEDDTIRYLSLHDNTYIRYFRGHKGLVNSLEVASNTDGFISSSLDNTVRLWDLRSANCHGLLNIPTPAAVSYDPTAVVFAVASRSLDSSLLLYDARMFENEPFLTCKIEDSQIHSHPRLGDWTSVQFSNDGTLILLTTKGPAHYIVDAYSGNLVRRLVGFQEFPADLAAHACFTPDGQFVIGGSNTNGIIHVWDLSKKVRDINLYPSSRIQSTYGTSITPRLVQFSPRQSVIVSADTEVAMWLPSST